MNQVAKTAVAVSAPLKHQLGVSVFLHPGQELWEDRNGHALRARLTSALKAGEVATVSQWRDGTAGAAAVVVQRIHTPRSKVPWYVGGTVLAMGAMVGVGVLLYESRWVLLCAAGIIATAWLIIHLAGHGGGCVGIHCSGCKG